MSAASGVLPDPRDQPTLTVEETAHIMRLSRMSTYRAIKAGEIPSIRVGRRILVPTAALQQLLGVTPSR